eukprot:Skav202001  [mRNA]  locus=scaffold269:376329:382549:+ [translate_table: standard]
MDSLNILGHLPPEEFREARGLIIDVILHTDRYRHLEVLNDVRGIARQGYAPKSADHSSSEGIEILQVLMRSMMVFSDLAHQARRCRAVPGDSQEVVVLSHVIEEEDSLIPMSYNI